MDIFVQNKHTVTTEQGAFVCYKATCGSIAENKHGLVTLAASGAVFTVKSYLLNALREVCIC